MNHLLRLYFSQPELLRKAERDFVAVFLGLVVSSGVLSQDTPNLHTLWKVTVASASLAAWRIGRGLVDKLSGGALPPEPPKPQMPPAS